jgi:hypothetical protein
LSNLRRLVPERGILGDMLARPHLSIGAARRVRMKKPDPSLLPDVVAAKVLDAMRLASEALARAGVRHVVIGGLAVGANGYPRATKDVDFLVGGEAFENHANGLVTLRAGVPFQVNGVAIDFLSPAVDEAFLDDALAAEPGSIVEAAPLVYLKLKSPRAKDRVDVIELVKAGIDVDSCQRYLQAHAPVFLPLFTEAVERAAAEED